MTPPDIDRRRLLQGTGAAVGAVGLTAHAGPAAAQNVEADAASEAPALRTVLVDTTINNTSIVREVDARRTLLDLLRDGEGLTGTKVGCRHGQCGACTVHVDGRRVLACLTLAAQVEGRTVTTIEGVGEGETLHPVQQAFVDHDALQCGYCTPGQVMSAIGCIREGHAGSDEEIAEYMSGNLCRCGAYKGIQAAVADAAQTMEG